MGVEQGPSKPDPELFIQACLALGVYPSTTHGGDSAGDIQMAREAGAAGCIGICWRKQRSPFTGSGCSDRPTRRNPNWEI